MLNEVILQGRLTRDPELRYTKSQTAVCSFSLAVEHDRKDDDGTRGAEFFDCTAWRQTAEFVSKFMKKGSLVLVRGRLSIRSWTDNNGNKRTAPEINADNVYFCESKRRSDPDERAPMPTDADAPPEFENTPPRDIDELMQNFPGAVEYAEADGEDDFPF